MIERYWDLFSDYITSNYNLSNKLVDLKYQHTKRVANYMVLLGNRLALENNDLVLAYLIGLFHDLGRFEEAIKYDKFKGNNFDHALYSNKILFDSNLISKFGIPKSWYSIIEKAIFYHNKKELPDDMDPRTLLFAKMIRDADKIDIMKVVADMGLEKFCDTPKLELIDLYLDDKPIDLKLIDNSSEMVLLRLSFMKNLYFEESKKILEATGNKEYYINHVQVDENYQELFDFLVSKIDKKEKEKKYVRDKI